jgi:phage baseplate assembly protein W
MRAIAYPYTVDVSGEVLSTTSNGKIYLDRLANLMSTPLGQRPMLQNYGVDLKRALFENEYIHDGGEVVSFKKAVEQAVREAINTWMREVEIRQIEVLPPLEDGTSEIKVVILVPGDEQVSLTTSTAIFGNDGTVSNTQ